MSIATPDPSRLQLMVLLYGADPLDCLQLLSVDLCGADPPEASTPLIWMSLWSCLTHYHHMNLPASGACHLPPLQPSKCNGRHELPKCTSRGCNNALTVNRVHCTGDNTLFCANSMQFPQGLQELIHVPHASTNRASSTVAYWMQ